MAWKNETYDAARLAAERYYDDVLSKGIFPAELRRLPADRDEAIEVLADENVAKIRSSIPEEGFDEAASKRLAAYDANKLEKWLYENGDDPITAAKKTEFAEYQKLIVPQEGQRGWRDMSYRDLVLEMPKFGFDPAKKEDYQKFIETLAQHQLNYDRGQIVQQEVGNANPIEKLGMALNPTVTDEAIRQSLTGDFDDGRLNRAAATDLVTGALMGGMAASKNLMSSPLRIGLADAGAETLRQAANAQGGFRVDPFAPIGAGVAAATVPGGAQWLGGYLSRGGSVGARPLARGFQRGLRGADDPVAAERNVLARQLEAARNQSISAQQGATSSMQGGLAGVSDLESAAAWDNAARKLNALGIESRVEKNNVMFALEDAQRREAAAAEKFDMLRASRKRTINGVSKQRAVEEAAREADEAAKDVKVAEAALADYTARNPVINPEGSHALYVEDVIGMSPRNTVEGITITPSRENVARAMGLYDREAQFPTLEGGNVLTGRSYDANQVAANRLRSAFPEKYAAEASKGANKRNYNIGLALGKTLGLVGTSIEPNLRANPFQPESYADKVTNFKETKWFKSLPKEKKNAVERALKGE